MLIESKQLFLEDFESINPSRKIYKPVVSEGSKVSQSNIHRAAVAEYLFGKGDWFEHFRCAQSASKLIESKYLRHVSKRDRNEKFHHSNSYDEFEETIQTLVFTPGGWELHEEKKVVTKGCNKTTLQKDCRQEN